MKKKTTKRAVVVTTKHRGVFFGYVKSDEKLPGEIKLTQVRMCVYWSSDVRGVTGLSLGGPTAGCRITHAVPEVTIYNITSVMECASAAVEQWEKSIWS